MYYVRNGDFLRNEVHAMWLGYDHRQKRRSLNEILIKPPV